MPSPLRFLFLLASLFAVSCGSAWGEVKSETDAKLSLPDHPIVAGFDRFYAGQEEADQATGGRFLWGELNCASCHTMEGAAKSLIATKEAPHLGEVGARVDPDYLRAFIADPHGVKPGTTMPGLFTATDPAERKAQVEALTHYLVSLSPRRFKPTAPDGNSIGTGEALFHKAGCVACHAPMRGDHAELTKTSVPLVGLEKKYSVASLIEFLQNPLKARPSGRMPNMTLSAEESAQVASYLMRDGKFPAALNYAYYEGSWPKLPDWTTLKPKSQGPVGGIEVGVKRRNNNFGIRYQGFLDIERGGEYTFFLTSDDGSRLTIDGKTVVDNDGIHAATTKTAKTQLAKGIHEIEVGYFQGGGHVKLEVHVQGPGIKKGPIPSTRLRSTREPLPEHKQFVADPVQAEKGRGLFAELGCAACHALGGKHKLIASKLLTSPLVGLKAGRGCLSDKPALGRPHYPLSSAQRGALTVALKTLKQPGAAKIASGDTIVQTMTRLNCYACHERDKKGGVVRSREALFTSTDKDLGDEGRIPPHLTGVGDKLNTQWLSAVLTKAGVARPYMDARMPQFGEQNLGQLAAMLSEADRSQDSLPKVAVPKNTSKKAGHKLVGKQGLSCISCHMFNRHKSLGIQATDLALMPHRLRQDWFYRYMLNPQPFRPGTRMPAAWPEGKTFKRDILDGKTEQQILAVWNYLSDGRKAIPPEGLSRQSMEIIVGGEALMYRNFIQGAGSRGIAVGYPEQVSLALDADTMRLAVIWQGRFIDASKHWRGRGQGFEPPAGDKVVALVEGPPFARLTDTRASWPKETGKTAGYQFRGYRLDKIRRPTFHYSFGEVDIHDFPAGVEEADERHLVRTLSFSAPPSVKNLWYRAAAGKIEALDDSKFSIGEGLKVHFQLKAGSKPLLRESEGRRELLIPVEFKDGKAKLVQEYRW